MSIHVVITDVLGNEYDLLNYLIDFAKIQWGETKTLKAKLKNSTRTTTGISLSFIPHPTHQVGNAQDTYEAATMSLNDLGPFTPTITIASLSPNEERDLWIRWTMPPEALPGWGQFAIQVEGVVNV